MSILNPDGDGQQQEQQQQDEQGQQQEEQQQQRQAPEEGARPDFIPEEAWGEQGYDPAKHFELMKTGNRPASVEDYKLPEAIEGINMEEAAKSPLLAGLRTAAFDAGLDGPSFEKVAGTMLAEAKKAADSTEAEEIAKLGDTAKDRIGALNTWLGSALPSAQARAVASLAVSADAVMGLESLMKLGGRKTGSDAGGGGGGGQRKTRAQIEQIMLTPAYTGTQAQRDPTVIAEVDKWFEEEAKLNPKNRAPK